MRYAIEQSDGTVALLTHVPGSRRTVADIADGRRVQPVESLPDKRYERAWRLGDDGVIVDIPAARAVRLEALTTRAYALIHAHDRDVLDALERNDGGRLNQLRQRRSALRDLPVAMEADLSGLGTLEAIDAYLPSELESEL